KSLGFAAEDKIAARGKARRPELFFGLLGEEKKRRARRKAFEEGLPIRMHVEINFLPIIEPGTFHFFGIDSKSQTSHQVQGTTGRNARSPDIAGIPGDVRLIKNDMHATIITPLTFPVVVC